MRLLLDTHVVLWLIDDPELLPHGWPETIASADEVRLSAVVGWEIAVKRSLGRLEAPAPADIVRELTAAGYEPLPVTWAHATASGEGRSETIRCGNAFQRLARDTSTRSTARCGR